MQLSDRPLRHQRIHLRPRIRIFLHLLMLLSVVVSSLALPLVAQAQTPNSFWIPPYRPPTAPPEAESAGLDQADALPIPEPLRLIVDTDPGVDDAVALAWLLSVLNPSQIAAIVTVAGNTTVENATANVYSVLAQMGDPDVEVITGARKPLVQKLSASGKLIHGQDGLWGQQMAQASWWFRNREARNFYCNQAKKNPDTTVLALGPLTNLAEAVRHCRRDMQKFERVVILGGAKLGGNTTPVAEFNIWQDPEAARIVMESGMKIDLVPQDSFTQLGFEPLQLIGYPGDSTVVPPVPPIPSIFAASPQPVFQYLAFPVAIYAQTQLLGGESKPSIPDLTAAIFAVFDVGVTLPVPNPLNPAELIPITPALVDVIERPDAVRGQTIIGLGLNERLTMIATDRELDDLANNAFAPGAILPDFEGYIFPRIFEIISRQPPNADIPTLFNVELMRMMFLADLNATVASLDVQPESGEQGTLPESIYLPSVTSE